jgi:hypothetical protein
MEEMELDGTGSGLCPIIGIGITNIQTKRSITRKLVIEPHVLFSISKSITWELSVQHGKIYIYLST